MSERPEQMPEPSFAERLAMLPLERSLLEPRAEMPQQEVGVDPTFNQQVRGAAEKLDAGGLPTPDEFDAYRALATGLTPQEDGRFVGPNGRPVSKEAARAVADAANPRRWALPAEETAALQRVAGAKSLAELPDDVRAAAGARAWDIGLVGEAGRDARARLALNDRAQEVIKQQDAAAMAVERGRVHDEAMAAAQPDIEAKVDAAMAARGEGRAKLGPIAEATMRAGYRRQFAGAAEERAAQAADGREDFINANGGVGNLPKIQFKERVGGQLRQPEAGNAVQEPSRFDIERPADVTPRQWLGMLPFEREQLLAGRARAAEAPVNEEVPAPVVDKAALAAMLPMERAAHLALLAAGRNVEPPRSTSAATGGARSGEAAGYPPVRADLPEVAHEPQPASNGAGGHGVPDPDGWQQLPGWLSERPASAAAGTGEAGERSPLDDLFGDPVPRAGAEEGDGIAAAVAEESPATSTADLGDPLPEAGLVSRTRDRIKEFFEQGRRRRVAIAVGGAAIAAAGIGLALASIRTGGPGVEQVGHVPLLTGKGNLSEAVNHAIARIPSFGKGGSGNLPHDRVPGLEGANMINTPHDRIPPFGSGNTPEGRIPPFEGGILHRLASSLKGGRYPWNVMHDNHVVPDPQIMPTLEHAVDQSQLPHHWVGSGTQEALELKVNGRWTWATKPIMRALAPFIVKR